MTLGQLAVAVGATPRWVLNALTRLGLPRRRYEEPLARRLALARFISEDVGMPLVAAWRTAGRVLAHDPASTWSEEGRGGVELRVDLPRFFTTYGAQLALARNDYGERLRGRRPRKRKSAVQRAKEYGIDVTLLDSQLRLTPEERMRRVSEDMEVLSQIRGSLR